MVTTRFAPSPTGFLHIGGVRTALYSWLYARRHGGRYVLRIEDTDRERSTQAAVDTILDGLKWVGLEADAAPIFQTQRFGRYAEVLDRLLAEGNAYHCYCTKSELEAMRAEALSKGLKPRYDGRCRNRESGLAEGPSVVRFKNPLEGEVVLEDLVKGRIVFDNRELDDLIIARSDGTPTYNFTVVVDDVDMHITHVIRGDDHVNNTPRQINMIRALGAEPPNYGHLPMINGPDGAKLSKRHGAVSVLEYREMGFLPDALLNYLLRLGWSHGDQEIFDRDEMVRLFSLTNVQRSAANFDAAKLAWVNQQHMLRVPAARLAPLLAEQLERLGLAPTAGPPLEVAVDALRERSHTMAEMAARARYYYSDFSDYDAEAAKAHLRPAVAPILAALLSELAGVAPWAEAEVQQAVERVAQALDVKLGKVAQPLRVALTGEAASPGIGVTLVLVGRERTLARLARAVAWVAERAAQAAANSAG